MEFEDVSLVELCTLYLRESCCRRLGSLYLYLCDVECWLTPLCVDFTRVSAQFVVVVVYVVAFAT